MKTSMIHHGFVAIIARVSKPRSIFYFCITFLAFVSAVQGYWRVTDRLGKFTSSGCFEKRKKKKKIEKKEKNEKKEERKRREAFFTRERYVYRERKWEELSNRGWDSRIDRCVTDRDLHTPTQSSKALQIFRICGLWPCDKQEAGNSYHASNHIIAVTRNSHALQLCYCDGRDDIIVW